MSMPQSIAVPLDYDRIERGVSAAQVQDLIRKGLISREDVYRAVPERTFKRRLAEKGNLRIEEADAIARLMRVNGLARWAFGEDEQAQQFLDLPNPVLGGRVPRMMAATDAGAREVEAVLYRFAFGDYN
ncbi:antitoxin Xre/MbcA/ParS toxin-binding domain-containing protein [Aestuariivirga sp.]|uniref:antitoxin Xre/MbcA/ParS toxin-binding domain-containing protein n=1 Tax=Aestuariivirga sp. TaxID=2650926 RepID=UPI00359430BF